MTSAEVASLCLLPHSRVEEYHLRTRLTGDNARPVAMLLTLIELHAMGAYTNDVVTAPFPDLSKPR